MAIYRDLNEPLADWLAKRLSEKATETSPTGVKDLGSTGDVVWTEGGETKSVKDMAAEVADLLEQGLKTEHNTVSTNSPSSTEGFHDGEWWTQIAAADDTTVTGLWRLVDGEWVAQSIPDGGLVAPFADIGLMSVAMLSAKIITAGMLRSGTTGQRFELDLNAYRAYNSSGVLTVRLDGIDNLIDGELSTGSMSDGQLGAKIGRDPLNGSRYGLYFAKPPGFTAQPALRYSTTEGLMQLEGGNGGRVFFVASGNAGLWSPGVTQVHGRQGVALRHQPDGSTTTSYVEVDDRGVVLDGFRWTKQVVTNTSTYNSLSDFPPGRYDIRMNHPAAPTAQWGLLEVEFIAANNRVYSYRTDLGQVWTKTFANGSFTDWVSLAGAPPTAGIDCTTNAGWSITAGPPTRRSGQHIQWEFITTPSDNAPAGEHWVATATSASNDLGAGRTRTVGNWIAIGNNPWGGACVWDFSSGRIYIHTGQQINAGTQCQLQFNFITST